ncbi:MAG: LCP family protein [Clostridia bacterium]|nr:LCP family protein [Clostridia bacterium]
MKPLKRFLTGILYVIFLACEVLFMVLLKKLNVLPAKFFIPIAVLLAVVSVVLLSMKLKKKTVNASVILMLILIAGLLAGSYYIGRTLVFLSRMVAEPEKTEDYHILVVQDSEYIPEPVVVEPTKKEKLLLFLFPEEEEEDVEPYDSASVCKIEDAAEILKGKKIGTYMTTDRNYSEAKGTLSSNMDVECTYEADAKTLYDKLLSGEYEFILLSDISYQIMKDQESDILDKTDILYTLKFKIEEEEKKEIDVTKDSYNILLSGCDFFGKFASDTIHRSDVDMIATVNPVTHEVHLTSIPRDYYVKLHSYGEYDKLTHASLKGVEELKKTIEDTLGIEIQYYVRANFNGLLRFVDAIGGIDVESERDFILTVEGEYYSYKTTKHIVKGTNHLNGAEALSFCRERNAFSEGDLQRIRDQQIVFEAILKKATQSTTILTSYLDILNALSGRIETDFTPEEMAALVSMQLNEMPSWNITKTAITTKYGWEICYLAQYYGKLNVALQDEVQNAICRDEIFRVLSNRVISEGETENLEGESK